MMKTVLVSLQAVRKKGKHAKIAPNCQIRRYAAKMKTVC